MNDDRVNNRRELRMLVEQDFKIEELRVLSKDLGVDFENLAGETKRGKVDSLFNHLENRGRLNELVEILEKERPNIEWPKLVHGYKQLGYVEKYERLIFDEASKLEQSIQSLVNELKERIFPFIHFDPNAQNRQVLEKEIKRFLQFVYRDKTATSIRNAVNNLRAYSQEFSQELDYSLQESDRRFLKNVDDLISQCEQVLNAVNDNKEWVTPFPSQGDLDSFVELVRDSQEGKVEPEMVRQKSKALSTSIEQGLYNNIEETYGKIVREYKLR